MLVMAVSSQTAAQPVVWGIDHIPLAVADLERATADFEALGFTLKPGRPHKNRLRNAHVKLPGGTEIELITAPTEGRRRPNFPGIYAPDFVPPAERL